LDISIGKHDYIYSEKELNVFKQLKENLKQYGRLEESRTIENTAMRWMEQKK
jgi:hypothetical protein